MFMTIRNTMALLVLVGCVALATIPGETSAKATLPTQADLDGLALLQEEAETLGFSVERLEIHRSAGEPGAHAKSAASCTVSTTVAVPGGSGVTISTTAPTCAQAIRELRNAIKQLWDELIR